MKLRALALICLCLALSAAPAMAQYLYDNGPVNGTVDAWTINFGYTVSDTFTLNAASTPIGFVFWAWEFPGDTALTVDWSFTSAEFGGTTFASGTASVRDSFISVNQYGYDIDQLTVVGLNVPLSAGTYWLNLQNATTVQGNPLYWDENSGPSMASESALGTIPSEAFAIQGACGSGCGQTPEPGTILLLLSGALAVAGHVRRQLS